MSLDYMGLVCTAALAASSDRGLYVLDELPRTAALTGQLLILHL